MSSKMFSKKGVFYSSIVFITISLFCCFFLTGCRNGSSQKKDRVTTISNDQKCAAAVHYWDGYSFSDMESDTDKEISEKMMAGYIRLLYMSDYITIRQSLDSLLSKVHTQNSEKMPVYLFELFEKYLYDPNSPVRNDELYGMVLDKILNDTLIDDSFKTRYRYQSGELKKNRLGVVATDFKFTVYNGEQRTLHGINAEYTLLLFINPDCEACAQTIEFFNQSPIVETLLKNSVLKILAFYPDEDITEWKSHRGVVPSTWLYGRDTSKDLIVKRDLYSLRAIPSLYLLDKEKRVLLRDATAEQVLVFLHSL